METVKQAIDHAEQQCKKKGLRLTSKRKKVLSLLLKSGVALSAYELVKKYKIELGETLPAMSMYRFLEFLEKENLIHKLELNNKYIACEHIKHKQEHSASQFLICEQCQKVKELNLSKSIMLKLKNNAKSAGFRLASTQLEINGCMCKNCTANQS